MRPGSMDNQRPHVDLVPVGVPYPPPQNNFKPQHAPHPRSVQHTHPPPSTNLSTGLGHGQPSIDQSRKLPPPLHTRSPPGTSAHRHPGPSPIDHPRSYSVDSGARHQSGPSPTVRESLPQTIAHQLAQNGGANDTMAQPHQSHGVPAYVELPLPGGAPQHGHLPLVPQEQYPHPASTPMPIHHHPPYHGHYGPAPPGPATFASTSQYEASQQFRSNVKKAVRAVQACQQCRQRKQKCDEGRPRCGFCEKEGLPCEYKETQPPKQDRTILQILDRLDSIHKGQEILRQEVEMLRDHKGTKRDFSEMHGRSDESLTATRSPMSIDKDDEMDEDSIDTATALLNPSIANDMSVDSHDSGAGHPDSTAHIARRTQVQIEAQKEAQRRGEVAYDESTGIPAEHTTSVENLRSWPGIKELYEHAKAADSKTITEYEEAQGFLRLWGFGQTGDEVEDRKHDQLAASPASDHSDPHEPEGLWGTDQLDGHLRLDSATLIRLYESYFTHFHRLHPFLDGPRLKRMLDTFISKYKSTSSPASTTSPFVVPPAPSDYQPSLGSKRSRTGPAGTPQIETPIATPDYGTDVPPQIKPFELSLSNAIILLVVALGKIAEYKWYFRGPAEYGERLFVPYSHSSPQSAASPSASLKPSPTPSHATVSNASTPPASDHRPDLLGRPGAHDSRRQLRNVDIYPGLAYYASGTGILEKFVMMENNKGDFVGNQLHLIWAFLLAGLYMGHLCRAMESFGWIEKACKVWIRLKERYKESELGKLGRTTKDIDLVRRAYWTCLQMESDVRAELNYANTGIGNYQDRIAPPAGATDDVDHSEVWQDTTADMFAYSSQISLRKILNDTHNYVYGPGRQPLWEGGARQGFDNIERLRKMWKIAPSAPKEGREWRDDDPPSADINVARVRGKYYGTRYVVLRPFLQHAMYRITPRTVKIEDVSSLTDAHQLPFIKHPDSTTSENTANENMIIGAAKACIDSAMLSTVAFDGLKTRFLVTNIHGTALAQYGNMLVLCAAYNSWLGPSYANLVPRERLIALLDRTIELLERWASLSKVMCVNKQVLQTARQHVYQTEDPHPISGIGMTSATSSFSA